MNGTFITVTETGCHEWQKGSFMSGYARIKVEGRTYRVHRMVYELVHGPIPDGLQVMHSCDNRICVNPAHLSVGTGADNMADMCAKGRHHRNKTRVYTHGDGHPSARLTDAQVAEIRQRFDQGGTSQSRLAEEFGVSQALVSRIVRGLHRPDTY